MISLLDLDSIVHIVAYTQYKAGNRDNKQAVIAHVKRFVNNVEKNAKADKMLRFYQDKGHDNYRNALLPSYKDHRKKIEAVAHWKPTIIEAFQQIHAIALLSIESDDAINIVARDLEEPYVIISGDKDMKQVPGLHYNPFNTHLGKVQDSRRWMKVTQKEATEFLWQQVLTADSTDMPSEHCGIQGVGDATAKKLISKALRPDLAIGPAYIEKYGKEEGLKRAQITYKMVKLAVPSDEYLPLSAKIEIKTLLAIYKHNIKTKSDEIALLFKRDTVDPGKILFKK